MKLGIAGAGMIVRTVLSDLTAAGAYTVNAICATPASAEKLKNLCGLYRIPSWYMDYDRMLEEADVDTVYVAVPNHLHFSFCERALEKGKHVICEKPFTSNLREAAILFALAAKQDRILVEAVTTRYLPNVLKMKEALKKIGRIRVVSMNYSQYSSRYDAFKAGGLPPVFNPAMSGGALMDLNIYNINFALMLFGEPAAVDYHANVVRGIDTSGILTMDYGDFVCAAIAAKDCKGPLFSSLQGDEGCIVCESALNQAKSFRLLKNTDTSSKQMSNEGGEVFDYNAGRSKTDYEFSAFKGMVDGMDMEEAKRMMHMTLAEMKILTQARIKAGILFPADKEE